MTVTTAAPTKAHDITVEISTNCHCAFCQDCDMGFTASASDWDCSDCGAEGEPSNYCDGDCGEFARDMFTECWDERFTDRPVLVESFGVGWQRTSSVTILNDVAADDALSRLLGDEADLKAVFADSALEVTRWSHDEPTGARFSFTGLTDAQAALYQHLVEDGDVNEESAFRAAVAAVAAV
jgi:hypothetical protein